MMRLLRAPLLIASLSLLLFLGSGAPIIQAQTIPTPSTANPPTNQAAALGAKQAQDLYKQCKEKGTPCTIVVDDINVECVGDFTLGTIVGARKCLFAYPDHSYVLADPNFFAGAQLTRYNSAGVEQGTREVGGINNDTSGAEVTNLTANAKCEPLNLVPCFLNLPGYLLSAIGYAILVLSTFILFLAGTVFNWVVIRTVFQFATYFGTSEGMLVAWTVLRDIANIALLFGFVFIGVATILNTQSVEGYSAKKALPRLIIFAVLLNFSLFATQGIIDVANGFASIFSTYAGQECGQADEATGTEGQQNEDCANIGISGKIMSAAGMNHFPTSEGFLGGLERPYSTAAMLIILSILVSITAMVLFAASIMLVIRVVVLSLLMVTSPIGFAGLAIPSLNKIAQDWWHKLINQAFFAPLYLLMVFISLKLVDGLQDGGASITQAISADVSNGGTIAGNMQVVVVYAIVIGFMVGSLMVAQKMGAAGAGFATKTAGGLAFGAQGFVGRRTVGRLSNAAAQKVASSEWARKNPGLGRLAYAGLNKGATASFSSRNLAGNLLGKSTGVDFGKANKDAGHGFHGLEEKAVKARTDFTKTMKASEEQMGAGKELKIELKEREDWNKKELAPLMERVKAQQKRVADARKRGDDIEIENERAELKKRLARYTQREAEITSGDAQYQALKGQTKDWQKRGEKAATDQYIEALETGGHADWTNPYRYTHGSIADHHAAEKLVKEGGKTKLERALKDVQDAAEKGGDGGGGAPAPAPAQAPAGGGGGPAPAPPAH